ncbi:MAG: DASH family cryptochrome [Saprospiraceae bacterium]|nr:DASH family cryptochrome [Saprospiraceae bacterium]
MSRVNKKAIVWFRNDLRVHDNEALYDAITSAEQIVPVYIFDPRVYFSTTKFGFPKVGKFRTKFIIESIQDLKNNLQKLGSDLYVRVGKPEEEIPELARSIKSNWVFCNRERTQEEVDVQDAMEHNLWAIGQELRYSRGKMLYYTADLPFPVTHTPDMFTQFRKEVEKYIPVREPIPSPEQMSKIEDIEIEYGQVPTMPDLGHTDFGDNSKGGFVWKGGETEALRQLNYYLWETDLIKNYKETRNELLGRNFSSKFSPWLSQGCLSPKMIYAELKKYESERVKNKSTYWLFFELLWRDFFRLTGKKYGNEIFKLGGIKQDRITDVTIDDSLFSVWSEGRTGIPFIDANMKELNSTGFMSNRGRQNVASFLVNDLKLNWLMGAEYFESMLLDYDPCSNYGNWNYIAGVGTDPREDRYFNIISQAKRYDPKGEFVKYWLPEISAIPDTCIHTLDRLSDEELNEYNVTLGKDYPQAILNTSKW